MGVGFESQVFASCDMCGVDEFSSVRNLVDFKNMLRREGWSIGKTVLCPVCKVRQKVIRETAERARHERNVRRKAKK